MLSPSVVKYRSLATGAKFLSVLAVKALVEEKSTGQYGMINTPLSF